MTIGRSKITVSQKNYSIKYRMFKFFVGDTKIISEKNNITVYE